MAARPVSGYYLAPVDGGRCWSIFKGIAQCKVRSISAAAGTPLCCFLRVIGPPVDLRVCGVIGGVFWLLLEAGGRDQSDGVTCVLVRRD